MSLFGQSIKCPSQSLSLSLSLSRYTLAFILGSLPGSNAFHRLALTYCVVKLLASAMANAKNGYDYSEHTSITVQEEVLNVLYVWCW